MCPCGQLSVCQRPHVQGRKSHGCENYPSAAHQGFTVSLSGLSQGTRDHNLCCPIVGQSKKRAPRTPARPSQGFCKPSLAWGQLRPQTSPGGPRRTVHVFPVPQWNVGPQDVGFAVGVMTASGDRRQGLRFRPTF